MRKTLLALTLLFSSCNSVSSFLGNTTAPKGTIDEQITYHQDEIKKYKTRVNQEEHNAHRALTKSEISEVKRTQQRKAKYIEKIEEHTKELERLQASKKGVAVVQICIPTNHAEAEMRQAIRDIDNEMSSLNQLREYYIKKAGQARARSKYLQYNGYLMAACDKLQMALAYDVIVKRLQHRIGQLLLTRDDLVRRTTNFCVTPPPEA